MANWREVHKQDLESGDVYFQEAGEVTLPRGYRVVWITFAETPKDQEHKFRRPEMKIKDTNEDEPKVYSGLFSGVGQHVFSRFRWWMVSSPIDVTPGLVTRAKATVMILSHGIEGDDSRPGACGMRVGIVDADAITLLDDDLSLGRAEAEELALTPPPNWDKLKAQDKTLSRWDIRSRQVTPQIVGAEDDIAWSLWWVVRDSLENEGKWVTLQSDKPPPEDGPQPPFRPKSSQVRLILQCNADYAAALSAGHYDDLIVEQQID
jgi:hypothetical protein